MVLTTMSTVLFCSAVIRSADDRIRYSTCDGVPKMSRATSPAMSTSKPVISPVIGSRNENRLLPMSRPTISRPRSRIVGDGGVGVGLVGERPQAGGAVAVVVARVRRAGRLGRQLGHPGRGRAAPASAPAAPSVYCGAAAAGQHGRRDDRDAGKRAQRSSALCSSRERSSPVLAQSRPQAQRHRDRRADRQHRAADRRPRQHPPGGQDVVAQLIAAFPDAAGQRRRRACRTRAWSRPRRCPAPPGWRPGSCRPRCRR